MKEPAYIVVERSSASLISPEGYPVPDLPEIPGLSASGYKYPVIMEKGQGILMACIHEYQSTDLPDVRPCELYIKSINIFYLSATPGQLVIASGTTCPKHYIPTDIVIIATWTLVEILS